jgi:hypothetical protein
MRNQYKLLQEKYSLIKEDGKEDMLAGLDAVIDQETATKKAKEDIDKIPASRWDTDILRDSNFIHYQGTSYFIFGIWQDYETDVFIRPGRTPEHQDITAPVTIPNEEKPIKLYVFDANGEGEPEGLVTDKVLISKIAKQACEEIYEIKAEEAERDYDEYSRGRDVW